MVLLLLHKKSRSVRLIACKRVHNGSLSLPIFYEFFYAIWNRLVGLGGLEPPTSRLSGVRSNLLSYRPSFAYPHPIFGGDEEDRTPDLLRAKQALSQLSYTPIGLENPVGLSKLNSVKVDFYRSRWTKDFTPCQFSLERR